MKHDPDLAQVLHPLKAFALLIGYSFQLLHEPEMEKYQKNLENELFSIRLSGYGIILFVNLHLNVLHSLETLD